MPRATYKILNFSGGLSDHTNARDILDNEFATCIGFDITDGGRLRLLGDMSSVQCIMAASEEGDVIALNANSPGYGFYVLDLPFPEGTANTSQFLSSGTVSGAKSVMLAQGTTDTKRIVANEVAAGGASTTEFYQIDAENMSSPLFYYVDGGLRIIDAGFGTLGTHMTPYIRKWIEPFRCGFAYIAECIWFDAALSDDDMTPVSNYLNNKYSMY